MFTPTTPREGTQCLVLSSTLLDWKAGALGWSEILTSFQIPPVLFLNVLFLVPDAGPGVVTQNCCHYAHLQDEQTEALKAHVTCRRPQL